MGRRRREGDTVHEFCQEISSQKEQGEESEPGERNLVWAAAVDFDRWFIEQRQQGLQDLHDGLEM